MLFLQLYSVSKVASVVFMTSRKTARTAVSRRRFLRLRPDTSLKSRVKTPPHAGQKRNEILASTSSVILVDIACVPSPRSLSRSPCSPGSGTLCATSVRHHPSTPLAHCPSPQTARQLTYRHAGLYHKNAKLLFLGLDNAGKTTLLYLLRTSRVSQHSPTQQPTSEEVSIGSIRFRAFDLGGHASARQIWRNYYARVDGIVFLVDLADRARFPEANLELDWLMSDDMLSSELKWTCRAQRPRASCAVHSNSNTSTVSAQSGSSWCPFY